MEPVVGYQAVDGSVWDKREDDDSRDSLVAECDALVRRIGLVPRPADSGMFVNGEGVVQQPQGARDMLLAP